MHHQVYVYQSRQISWIGFTWNPKNYRQIYNKFRENTIKARLQKQNKELFIKRLFIYYVESAYINLVYVLNFQ